MEECESSLNNEKIKRHLKVLNRHCIPVFVVLALFKVVLGLGLLAIIGYVMILSHFFTPSVTFFNIALPIAFFIDVLDIVIGFVAVIGVCMKNLEVMEIYYRFSIYVLGTLAVMCCVIFYIMTRNIGAMLISFLIFSLVLMMQMYLSHIVKVEVLKQKGNEQFQLLKADPIPQSIYNKQVQN